MPHRFTPLSAVPVEAAAEYLVSQGIAPDVARWKYFDRALETPRERGYFLLDDRKPVGFLGLVPFALRAGEEEIPTAWTCDWSLDPALRGSPAGILLLKQTLAASGLLFQLGGNQITRKIYGRLASLHRPAAGLTLFLPLRAGFFLEALRRLVPLPWDASAGLNSLPVRWLNRPGANYPVHLKEGIAPQLEPLTQPGGEGWQPHYGLDYLDWQLGRCPRVCCYSGFLESASGTPAGAVAWHERESGRHWRLHIWPSGGARLEWEAVLRGMVHFAYERGAEVISVLLSPCQTQLLRDLKHKGFLSVPRRRPLYVLSAQASRPVEELHSLSFLDTDLAYRF